MDNKKLVRKIQIRCSDFEKNRIKWLADKYAGGNISLLMTYATLNVKRGQIKPEDVEIFSKRRGHKK